MNKINIKDLCPQELEDLVRGFGEEAYRARQIGKWIYRKDANSFNQMTDLPKRFIDTLNNSFLLNQSLVLLDERLSSDGTKKYLFQLSDGRRIESVLMPEIGRCTLCISTQVGCALGCTFCLTGTVGKIRDLNASEIIDQYLLINKFNSRCVTNLVFMGMGEPLDNLENTVRALKTFTHKDFSGISPKKITVSTSGLVPQLRELGKRISVNLSVSLNAPLDELRSKLMPINRRYPIESLIKASGDFPMPNRKDLTFEYVLIKGLNDSDKIARTLGRLLKGMRCKVNLIPFNEVSPLPYETPSRERVLSFQSILVSYGINARIRKNRGRDILGACGQLAASYPTAKGKTKQKVKQRIN
jgi:23S rRNA (adenine2503-C2)-methyltransferase